MNITQNTQWRQMHIRPFYMPEVSMTQRTLPKGYLKVNFLWRYDYSSTIVLRVSCSELHNRHFAAFSHCQAQLRLGSPERLSQALLGKRRRLCTVWELTVTLPDCWRWGLSTPVQSPTLPVKWELVFLYQTYLVDLMILQYLSHSFALHYLAPHLGIYKMKSSTTMCFTATLLITSNNLRHTRSPMISKTCSSGGTGTWFCVGFFWVQIFNFMSGKFSATTMCPLTCHSRWRFSQLPLQDSKWPRRPSTQG